MTANRDERRPIHKRLISLDIDGTMEFGDPPGPVTIERIRQAQEQGHLVGSASDRPLADQRKVWKENGFDLGFIILKHWMAELKEKFDVDEYWHVGDSQMDEVLAAQAGFTFFWAESFPEEVASYDGHSPDTFELP